MIKQIFVSQIVIKISSMIQHEDELILWFYTWFKFGAKESVEQLLSNCIEKIILNPYPLVEKSHKHDA